MAWSTAWLVDWLISGLVEPQEISTSPWTELSHLFEDQYQKKENPQTAQMQMHCVSYNRKKNKFSTFSMNVPSISLFHLPIHC